MYIHLEIISNKGGIVLATHEIPRNVKGERKNINDFYNKITTIYLWCRCFWINILFYIWYASWTNLVRNWANIIIGFAVATFKIPDTNAFELTRKAGGEYIDKVFIKWLKFRKKGNRIYTYVDAKEETK